jgi:hypothetical protein
MYLSDQSTIDYEIKRKVIPRGGYRTPSNQILEFIKNVKDSVYSCNSKPNKGVGLAIFQAGPGQGSCIAHFERVLESKRGCEVECGRGWIKMRRGLLLPSP